MIHEVNISIIYEIQLKYVTFLKLQTTYKASVAYNYLLSIWFVQIYLFS